VANGVEYQVAIMPGVYQRYDPRGSEVPVIFDVSRSGREYPSDFRSPMAFSELHDNVSMYMDEYYFHAPDYGATLLYATFPHMYIDANRAANDIDPAVIDGEWPVPIQQSGAGKRGLGLIKTTSRYGNPVQEEPLRVEEITRRITKYHEPYHRELSRVIREKRERYGLAVQISCHCMSAVGMPTHPDPGQDRADFCIGDMNGTTASPEYRDLLVSLFKDAGYSVSVNTPYDGGILMSRNADVENNIHSLMIETNKRLFIDINTFKETPSAFATRQAIEDVIRKLCSYAGHRAGR
jgi:N-formylglutamate deformylase